MHLTPEALCVLAVIVTIVVFRASWPWLKKKARAARAWLRKKAAAALLWFVQRFE